MAELKDFRQTKKITLPGVPESELEIYDSIVFGDTIMESGVSENDRVLHITVRRIKAWNLTEEGKPLPITADVLRRLPMEDATLLLEELNRFEVKKK